jgi:hypothetical protein
MTKPPKRPSKAASSFEKDALGWLASHHTDGLGRYLARGRSHKDLPKQQLTERWIEALKKVAEHPRNHEMRATLNALTFEFDMRGVRTAVRARP